MVTLGRAGGRVAGIPKCPARIAHQLRCCVVGRALGVELQKRAPLHDDEPESIYA